MIGIVIAMIGIVIAMTFNPNIIFLVTISIKLYKTQNLNQYTLKTPSTKTHNTKS